MRLDLKSFAPRNVLSRLTLRNVDFRDRHWAFRLGYWLPDPYDLTRPAEVFRFKETNRIIAERFGRVGRLLEVGCAEGYQSLHLSEVCDQLHGVDVSPRAVARAMRRCPGATFSVGDVFSVRDRFDLVVACEVLYYMKDIPAAIARLAELGSACLVTYDRMYWDALDRHFEKIAGAETSVICCGEHEWKAVWWRGAREAVGSVSDGRA